MSLLIGTSADGVNWTVERHSGRGNDEWRVRYRGIYDGALTKFRKLQESLRQGGIALVNPHGFIIERVNAPRLRTRW